MYEYKERLARERDSIARAIRACQVTSPPLPSFWRGSRVEGSRCVFFFFSDAKAARREAVRRSARSAFGRRVQGFDRRQVGEYKERLARERDSIARAIRACQVTPLECRAET